MMYDTYQVKIEPLLYKNILPVREQKQEMLYLLVSERTSVQPGQPQNKTLLATFCYTTHKALLTLYYVRRLHYGICMEN